MFLSSSFKCSITRKLDRVVLTGILLTLVMGVYGLYRTAADYDICGGLVGGWKCCFGGLYGIEVNLGYIVSLYILLLLTSLYMLFNIRSCLSRRMRISFVEDAMLFISLLIVFMGKSNWFE